MAEKILIAQAGSSRDSALGAILRAAGFQVQLAFEVARTTDLLGEFPALILLDVTLASREPSGSWDDLGRRCKREEIPCLLFSSSGCAPAAMKDLAPWGTDTILALEDYEEVLSKVNSQLTIRRLTYEVNLAHGLLLEKQQEIAEYHQSAALIQTSLLPPRLPEIGPLHFAWRFLPCAHAGGDLFNVVHLDERTVMVYLFDVCGHGVSAAMVTVSVFQSLSLHTGRIVKRALAAPPYYRIPSPAEVLEDLDSEYPFERFEKFFTIAYVLLDTVSGQVTYSCAGHPPPLLVRADGGSEPLRRGGPVIGMGNIIPFEEGELVLAPGDRLFLYSDGITEYMDPTGAFYGEERLFRKLSSQRKRSLDPACGRLIEDLYAFGRGSAIRDDVTLLGIEFTGAS